MSGKKKNLRSAVCVIALASVLAGCGGGGAPSAGSSNTGSSNSQPDDNTPVEIQGVDTPSSVSVVTATNAN